MICAIRQRGHWETGISTGKAVPQWGQQLSEDEVLMPVD
jgi:hypothetical protein